MYVLGNMFYAFTDIVHVIWDKIDIERKLPYQKAVSQLKVHVCVYLGICLMRSLTLFTSYGTQLISKENSIPESTCMYVLGNIFYAFTDIVHIIWGTGDIERKLPYKIAVSQMALLTCGHVPWVKAFRIIPKFRILRLTFHRKSASKC